MCARSQRVREGGWLDIDEDWRLMCQQAWDRRRHVGPMQWNGDAQYRVYRVITWTSIVSYEYMYLRYLLPILVEIRVRR
jgi:hypothetical protein